jgi:phospholipid/cholesterol/gamma-HCH transport system substrate-binding protein
MVQRKQLTWTELRVGVFVLIGLAILAIGIFYITGAGSIGPKYRLITYLPEVQGVTVGAPVSLDGVEIGNVETIRINPSPGDRMQNIQLVLRISTKFASDIRADSTASLVTEGLLGNRYVNVTRGHVGAQVQNNGTLPGSEEAEMKAIMERVGGLADDLRAVVAEIRNGQGSIGKLLNDPTLYNNLNATAARLNQMAGSIEAGRGSVGKLLNSDELYTKVNATVGNVNDVVTAVKDQKGTAGKLIYDPAVYDNAKNFLNNGNAVLADARAGKGSLGKIMNDDQLYNNLRDASAQVRDATAKLNSNTGTAGRMMTDPALYDNLTGATADLRLLLGDFRKDPKKFLHVKLSIF